MDGKKKQERHFPVKWWPFERLNGTSVTSEQNTTCKGHLAFQKATISLEYDDHSFFFPSTNFYYY